MRGWILLFFTPFWSGTSLRLPFGKPILLWTIPASLTGLYRCYLGIHVGVDVAMTQIWGAVTGWSMEP